MNWDNETVMRFLELYQINSCIWDPQNGAHKNRQTVSDAWNDIKENLGIPCTVKELKKKKESLMSAYRGYKTKIKRSESLASGAADVYQPVWFAFSYMDSFLGSVYNCNVAMRTEDEETIIPDQLVKEENVDTTNTNRTEPSEWKLELEDPQHEPLPHSSDLQQSSTMTQAPPKRKHHKPPDLMQAKKQMDEVFSFMRQISQQQPSKDPDDECSIFGTLIAKKLRKLSEERRDVMMVKINQLFVDERYDCRLPTSSRPNSASTTMSYTTSPPQMYHEVSSPKLVIDADPLTPYTDSANR